VTALRGARHDCATARMGGAHLAYAVAVGEGHHGKVRVLATGRRVHSDKETCVKLDPKRNTLVEHLFQQRLLETLIFTVEGDAPHF